jgi:hypothetical protein
MLARISGEAGAELLGTSRQVGFPAPESLVARGRLEIASESGQRFVTILIAPPVASRP